MKGDARSEQKTPNTISEYIADFPPDVQIVLQKVRQTIQTAAPNAIESISYRIPTYKLDGKVLIYFAGFAKHVSVYPAPRDAREFEQELAEYKGGKGTVQFPLDKAIPYDLITRIVNFKIANIG